MAVEDKTKVDAEADGQRNTDADTEGTDTGADDAGTGTETEKSFTQAEVNQIVKARLAERDRTLKAKYEKQIEEKVAEARTAAQADLDKAIEERVKAKQAEEALAAARTAIKEEYGLTDAQVDRLKGETADELIKDAADIYAGLKSSGDGTQRKKPPVLKPNGGSGSGGLPDISKMSPAEIRANYKQLMAQATGKG